MTKKQRFIFVTGGVVSSLGKGICAASIAALLSAHKFKVRIGDNNGVSALGLNTNFKINIVIF